VSFKIEHGTLNSVLSQLGFLADTLRQNTTLDGCGCAAKALTYALFSMSAQGAHAQGVNPRVSVDLYY